MQEEEHLQSLISWVRFIFSWLRHAIFGAWPVLLILLLPVICGLFSLTLGVTEQTFRLSGGALQIFGFLLTMWDLISQGRVLNAPGLKRMISGYFAGFPTRNRVMLISGSSAMAIAGSGHLTIGRNPKATTKQRLDRLESDVDQLDAKLIQARAQTDQKIEAVSNALKDSKESLSKSVDALDGKLNTVLAAGLPLQWVGIFYFVIGILIASLAPELGCLGGDTLACPPAQQ